MIGTELLSGQGLGNQLFCYVTARAIAKENGYEFGICNPAAMANNIHNHTGMYFMNLDMGHEITAEEKARMQVYEDNDVRLYLGNSVHDLTHGAYISGADPHIHDVQDSTLIMGNMQDESYFASRRGELADWLKVLPEYDSHEFTRDNLCVIHLRCGDYSDSPELWLGRRYWRNGMRAMRAIRPDMEFLAVTDDVAAARKILPEVRAVTNDIGKDYVTIKNARYLLLSNSSFAVFPAMTSDTLRYAIAPKYWARHNVSNGYWASEQNIYSIFHYMDRRGDIFSAEECRSELAEYKAHSPVYARRGQRATGPRLQCQRVRARYIYSKYMVSRAIDRLTY